MELLEADCREQEGGEDFVAWTLLMDESPNLPAQEKLLIGQTSLVDHLVSCAVSCLESHDRCPDPADLRPKLMSKSYGNLHGIVRRPGDTSLAKNGSCGSAAYFF